jgi:hypothetical protein
MASLTLAIDDDLLRRAREAALRENTSVNVLVRDFLGSSWMHARAGWPLSRTLSASPEQPTASALSNGAVSRCMSSPDAGLH